MTHKKYELSKENEPILVKYICKTLNYNLIDSEMASYFKNNLGNVDLAIAKNSTLLAFLVDIVYSVVIFLEQKQGRMQHDTIQAFTDEYYIDFNTLIYIIDLVILDFTMDHSHTQSIPSVDCVEGN